MFVMPQKQLNLLQIAGQENFTTYLVKHLRANFPANLPASDDLLRESVNWWISNGKQFGLYTDQSLQKFVETCATTQGQQLPLKDRLILYLKLHHPELLIHVDAEKHAQDSITYAGRAHITSEEGIVWLSVLMLLCAIHSDSNNTWFDDIFLSQPASESAKLHAAQQQALNLGWVIE